MALKIMPKPPCTFTNDFNIVREDVGCGDGIEVIAAFSHA